jgi:hypothetical protein
MYHLVNNLDNDTTDWVCTDSAVFYGEDGVYKPGYTLNFNSNNLEILDSIHGYAFQYKYNNKLYYVDSKFICCDLNRDGSIIQTNIFDYLEGNNFTYFNIKNLFSKEKDFFLFYSPLESPYDKTYIYVVDTLGNILRSDSMQRRVGSFEIIEQGNNILFSDYFGYPYSSQSQLYLIDKQSLKIVDSISNINYMCGAIATINDSIIIAESADTYPNRIYQINTITHDENTLINSTIPQDLRGTTLAFHYNRRVDYINKDSIYLCFLTELPCTSYYPDSLVRICIANFNISGILNYTYLIDFNIEEHQKIISGVKATDDGGLLMAVSSRRYWPASQLTNLWTNYVIKFMPNGYSSITNVETGEKESIKVYPNPARDYINVDIECTNFNNASSIELFDMQGRIVRKEKLKAKQGNRVDVSSLSAGAYSYNVSLNGKTISGKVIVEK